MTANDLRTWRIGHGLTPAEVAELLPCHVTTWQAWESGQRQPRMPIVLTLALSQLSTELAELAQVTAAASV